MPKKMKKTTDEREKQIAKDLKQFYKDCKKAKAKREKAAKKQLQK